MPRAFDTIVKEFNEMRRTYEAKLATLRVELAQRGQILLAIEVECT